MAGPPAGGPLGSDVVAVEAPAWAEVGGDLAALLGAAALVQVAFPDRVDLAAHVVAGGGVALVVAALAPRRTRSWIAPLVVVACLVAATVGELLQPGVLDHGDVAYTGAGSLLVVRSAAVVVGAPGRRRAAAVLLGATLIVIGLVLRHGW